MRTPNGTAARSSILLATFGLLALAGHADRAGADAETPQSSPPRGHLRAALPAREGPHSPLWPLAYWGGFQTKTAVYEPLVRFGSGGTLEPALASSFEVADGGRTFRLRVREGVTCHDGTTLCAADIRDHLLRWRGNPGNRWLGSTDKMASVEVTGPSEVTVRLTEPWCFLEECAIVNPSHVVPAGAYDHEGTFRRPVGTGPYVVDEIGGTGEMVLTPNDGWWQGRPGLARIELTRLVGDLRETQALVDWVRDGGIDFVADGEGPIVPRELLAGLAGDARVRVHVGPGSGTTMLLFETRKGPFRDRELRRRAAAAIDRDAFVREGELGYAEPTTTLFRGGFAGWPAKGAASAPSGGAPSAPRAVARLVLPPNASARVRREAALVTSQLRPIGVDVVVEVATDAADFRARVPEGRADLALRSTHGTPYDPFVSLQTLFLARGDGRTASSSPALWEDEELVRAVRAALGASTPEARSAGFAAIQRRLDDEVPLVPLFISKRVALSSPAVTGLSIGENGYDVGLGRATSRLRQVAIGAPPGAAARPQIAASAVLSTSAPAAPVSILVGPAPAADPKDGEVVLPAESGWNASLVLDNGKDGVWAVESFKVFDRLGCPEIVGLDDKGRCLVLTSYSGRWTPIETVRDGKWLGGIAHADVDPVVPGPELYVGGEKGNLYEVVAHPEGVLDNRLVASLPGQAINILVAADVDPSRPGIELVAFTWPDGLYVLGPSPGKARFDVLRRDPTPERVRDALILPGAPGAGPEIVTASRNGHVSLLRFTRDGPVWSRIHEEPMGMGRVALRPASAGTGTVLYSCLDDGRVLRHARDGAGAWSTETIYLGPQGARGLVAGRFDADASVETLAVYGYSGRVEMLSRRATGWKVETIFRDRDKGHWLAVAELDGRNSTDEIVASGYGARIVMLSRPVGYGRTEAVDPEARR